MTGVRLDDPSTYAAVDAADALGVVERTAEQWGEALRRARAADALPSGDGVRSVVFCGMGGSGIAGDVLSAIAAERGRAPVTVVKGYDLPAFVDEDTLVIAASYSGNTEETLSCFDQAIERKARVVTLTTGGKLAVRAEDHGLARISPVEGIQPRAALASLAVPTLVVAERAGILPDLTADLAEAQEFLDHRARGLARDVPTAQNEAKQLAERLDGRLPHVWGQDGALAVAAIRWRCQINENAKMPSTSGVLPELDHNEIVGYEPGLPLLAQTTLVVLRVPDEHPRVAKRIDVTLDAVRGRVADVVEAWGTGASTLTRLMTVSMLGDFTSVYLALLRGVDPTPVHVIETLKERLA